MTETDEDQARRQTKLALRREIRSARAQVVADIDELRDSVKVRLSLGHIMRAHPKITQGLSLALGVAAIATLAGLWRATQEARRTH